MPPTDAPAPSLARTWLRERRFWAHQALPALLFLAFMAGQTTYLGSHAMNNWDALPYSALALAATSSLATPELHRETYASAQRVAPNEWRGLSEGNPYNVATAKSPEKFAKQFAFYRDRVLYIGATALAQRLGVEPFRAPFVVSLICYVLLCLMTFAWLRRATTGWTGLVATVVIANLPFVVITARLGTPDAMCTLFTVAATYALVERRRVVWFGVFGLLAIASRPDCILFVGMVLGSVLLLTRADERPPLRLSLIIAFGTLLAFLGLEAWTDRAAWWDVVAFTLVNGSPDWPASQPFVLKTYLTLLTRNWPLGEGYYGWLVYLMGFVAVRGPGIRRITLIRAVLIATIFSGLARYFSLPRFFDWDRHYASAYVPTLILAIVLLAGRRPAPSGSLRTEQSTLPPLKEQAA